jgi:integrase
MPTSAPNKPQPSPSSVDFEGRTYPLLWEPSGWRLRSKAKTHRADFRTGTTNLKLAQSRAKEWLKKRADDPITSRKGGGTLEALTKVYLATPKRTKENSAKDNVSRLRTVVRVALGKELEKTTCREVGPELWAAYQRKVLTAAKLEYNLATRYRENIAINAAVRAARAIFLPQLVRVYRAAGLDVRPDVQDAEKLPEPYVPPTEENDEELIRRWAALKGSDLRLWLVIGIARFAGLRREEISACRAGWISVKNGVVGIDIRDRPEEKWWHKTGRKPYRAQVINPDLAAHLAEFKANKDASTPVVPDPPNGGERSLWFERVPQQWLHAQGITAAKPLHRLRGLYADNLNEITADATAAKLAGLRAAQEALGHTTSATTEKHYTTPEVLK